MIARVGAVREGGDNLLHFLAEAEPKFHLGDRARYPLGFWACVFLSSKWLIYVPRSHEVSSNRESNERNRRFRLPRSYLFIYLFMRVSIARGSCAKADFRAIILGPRLSTLRVIGIYYTLEVRLPASSSFVREQEVPLLPERRKPIPIVRLSSNSPGEDSPREFEVSRSSHPSN